MRSNINLATDGSRFTGLLFTLWCDEGKYFDVAAPHGRGAESKPMQRTRVSVGSVTTAAAKCVHRRSIVIIIELSYRIFIAIILIYRIVYRSKTVFDIS